MNDWMWTQRTTQNDNCTTSTRIRLATGMDPCGCTHFHGSEAGKVPVPELRSYQRTMPAGMSSYYGQLFHSCCKHWPTCGSLTHLQKPWHACSSCPCSSSLSSARQRLRPCVAQGCLFPFASSSLARLQLCRADSQCTQASYSWMPRISCRLREP